MKRVITSLLAILFVLPMVFPLAACTTETGGENMANYLYNGVELPDINTVWTDKETYPYALITFIDASFFEEGAYMASLALYSSVPYVSGTDLNVTPAFEASLTNSSVVQSQYQQYGKEFGLNQWSSLSSDNTGAWSADVIIWSNYDILNTDGSVYLAASDPVPVGGSKLTISTGSANGDGMALYNGVMLPKLPEGIDLTATPYLMLAHMSGMAMLYVSSVPYVNEGTYIACEDSSAIETYMYDPHGLSGTVISDWTYGGSLANGPALDILLWCNTDILNSSDSSVYLAASDPIPLDGMNVITWDGDTTGLTSVLDMFHKVSDTTPTEAQLNGGYAVFNNQNGTPTYLLVSGETLVTDGDIVVILDGAFVATVDGASLEGETIPEKGIYFAGYDGAYCSLLAYPASSGGGVTDTTATVNFTCKDLLYTDSVYRIKAWVYKVADGLDVTLAPTWTSDLFAGPSHSESHTFTGLTPATEYGIYAVIWSETDGAATEHNATATFTTLEGEGLNATIAVDSKLVEYNTCVYNVTVSGLPEDYTTHEGNFWLTATLHDGTTAEEKMVFSGSPTVQFYFGDLKENTEYTVTFELFYANEDYTKGASTGITFEDSFTTGELPGGGFDRDAFLLGFASGLGCTAATKTDADHNTWMQGYIVGDALRSAIMTKQSFKYEVPDLSAAVRVVAEFYADSGDALLFNAHNGSMILGVSTPNDGTFADRYGDTRYMIPIPADASKVTVETNDTQVTMAQFIGVNGSNGSYTKVFSSAREAVYSYEFEKGSAQYMAIDLIYEDTGAVKVPWDYDVAATTKVTFT